jgi:hypothetical protein
MITKGSQLGNNVRFNNCTFEGPVPATMRRRTRTSATRGVHRLDVANNTADATATIVSPQANIEMGSSPILRPPARWSAVVAGNTTSAAPA